MTPQHRFTGTREVDFWFHYYLADPTRQLVVVAHALLLLVYPVWWTVVLEIVRDLCCCCCCCCCYGGLRCWIEILRWRLQRRTRGVILCPWTGMGYSIHIMPSSESTDVGWKVWGKWFTYRDSACNMTRPAPKLFVVCIFYRAICTYFLASRFRSTYFPSAYWAKHNPNSWGVCGGSGLAMKPVCVLDSGSLWTMGFTTSKQILSSVSSTIT